MGKKDKKNKQKQKQQNQVAPKKSVVTQGTITEANALMEEAKSTLTSIPENEVNVAEIEASYVTDGSVSSADVEKCISELRKSLKVLNSTQQRYEELKSQLKEDQDKWESEKIEEQKKLNDNKKTADEEIKAKKQEYDSKLEELHQRELKLIEDEESANTGDHSAIIDRLIKAYKQRKEEIVVAAETHLQSQSDLVNEYLLKIENATRTENQLIVREKELESREKKVKVLERVIEEERESVREELQKEVKSEYDEQLNNANEDKVRYKTQLEDAERETGVLRGQLEVIQSAFGTQDPMEMASLCQKLKEEISSLKEDLASRPLQNDLDTKQKEIESLIEDVKKLHEALNEKEYYELRKMFDNKDELIRDKQLLVDQNESLKAREVHLRDTIDDLRRTISEINETHNKGNAFKASSKYDTGDFQVPLAKATAPSDLSELVCYLQSFMAHMADEKERRYYSKDTIKKFIAGLNMSPITILQGISGTGKTSLPRAVAMAMMAEDARYDDDKGDDELSKAPYRICPIQSGWRDKMDLMGFYNSFEKSYHETEFFNALYLANQPKYEHTLFFIILDEMNLSRPEHYFADFLSKLELSSEEQRKVKIDNVPQDLCPISIKGGTLAIPKNVRFIGTANHDETTLEFAPKTYDRSNVIDMPRNCPKDKIPETDRRYNITFTWLNEKFAEAEKSHTKECKQFDEFIKDEDLINLLAEKGIGIGNRFEGQAKRFISVFVAAGDNPKSDIAKAADHLMTTRLLRTLKNNFDIDYSALNKFKENYELIFTSHFNVEPIEAKELIDRELIKKPK